MSAAAAESCSRGRAARSVAARLLFALHLCACVVLLVVMHGALDERSLYWIAFACVAPLLAEAIVTLIKTRGNDWKWLSPAVLCYVAAGAALTWLLEDRVLQYFVEGALQACNNISLFDSFDAFNGSADWASYCGCGRCNAAAEQLLLATLVVGRWLLPTGRVPYASNDNVNHFLLQLAKVHSLLSTLCNAADSLDFINMIRSDTIAGDRSLVNLIIVVWSVSLCQFSLVPSATRRTKDGAILILAETDGWSNLVWAALDDAPYLGIRAYVVGSYRTLNGTVLFFMVKNMLVLCATLQKLVAMCRMTSAKDVEDFVTVEAPPPSQQPLPAGAARQVIAVQPRQRPDGCGGGVAYDDYDDYGSIDAITLVKGSMTSIITRRPGAGGQDAVRQRLAGAAAAPSFDPSEGERRASRSLTPSVADGGERRFSESAADTTTLLAASAARSVSRAGGEGSGRESYPMETFSVGGDDIRASTSMSMPSGQYFTHAYASAKEQELSRADGGSGGESRRVSGKVKLPLGKALMSGLRINGLAKAIQSAVSKGAKRLRKRDGSGGGNEGGSAHAQAAGRHPPSGRDGSDDDANDDDDESDRRPAALGAQRARGPERSPEGRKGGGGGSRRTGHRAGEKAKGKDAEDGSRSGRKDDDEGSDDEAKKVPTVKTRARGGWRSRLPGAATAAGEAESYGSDAGRRHDERKKGGDDDGQTIRGGGGGGGKRRDGRAEKADDNDDDDVGERLHEAKTKSRHRKTTMTVEELE